MYGSITPPEWYQNVILGVLADGLKEGVFLTNACEKNKVCGKSDLAPRLGQETRQRLFRI